MTSADEDTIADRNLLKCYSFLSNAAILLKFHSEGVMKFEAMPLSAKTRYSLKVAKLEIATEIQAAAIPHALAGRCAVNSKDDRSCFLSSFAALNRNRMFNGLKSVFAKNVCVLWSKNLQL